MWGLSRTISTIRPAKRPFWRTRGRRSSSPACPSIPHASLFPSFDFPGSPFAACLPLFFPLLAPPLRLPSAPCTPRQGPSQCPPRDPPEKTLPHHSPITVPPIPSIHPFHISQSAVSVSVSAASLARSPCLCPRPLAPLSHTLTTPLSPYFLFPSSPFPHPPPPTHTTAVSSLFPFSLLSRPISLSRNPSLLHCTVFLSAVLLYTIPPPPSPCRSDSFQQTFIRSRPQTRPYLELCCPLQSRRCVQCNNTEATSYLTNPTKADILFTVDHFSARPPRYSSPRSLGLKKTLAVFKTSNYPRALDLSSPCLFCLSHLAQDNKDRSRASRIWPSSAPFLS